MMIFANSAEKPESTLLALWECETIQSLWNKSFSWLDRSQSTRASSGDLVTLIRIRPHLSDIFAPTAWSLWCRRNKVHLNEAAQPLERIAEEACQYLKTYRNAHWRPPKFDGAVFEDFGEAGIGVVVQNYKAEVMASLSQTLQIQHR